jgi:hypothetical protein
MNTEQRIAALEAELAELKAPKQAAPSRPIDDRAGVRIVQLTEPSNFVRPTNKELRQLYDIVLGKYPQLAPRLSARWADDERQEHFDGFTWAFERLGFIGRAAAPDHKHYVNFWISEAQDWLRTHRPAHRGNIGAGYLVATLAHGDICFTVGDKQRGIVWAIGLTAHGGAKASDAWRKVLNGELMPPVVSERRYG